MWGGLRLPKLYPLPFSNTQLALQPGEFMACFLRLHGQSTASRMLWMLPGMPSCSRFEPPKLQPFFEAHLLSHHLHEVFLHLPLWHLPLLWHSFIFFSKYLFHAYYLWSVEWNTKELWQGPFTGFLFVYIWDYRGKEDLKEMRWGLIGSEVGRCEKGG